MSERFTIDTDADGVRDLRNLRQSLRTQVGQTAGHGPPAARSTPIVVELDTDLPAGDFATHPATQVRLNPNTQAWETVRAVQIRKLSEAAISAAVGGQTNRLIARQVSNLGWCVEDGSSSVSSVINESACCGLVLHEDRLTEEFTSGQTTYKGPLWFRFAAPKLYCCADCDPEGVSDTALSLVDQDISLKFDVDDEVWYSAEVDCGDTHKVRWVWDLVSGEMQFVERDPLDESTIVLAVWRVSPDVMPYDARHPIRLEFRTAVIGCYLCCDPACLRPQPPEGPCTSSPGCNRVWPLTAQIELPEALTDSDSYDGSYTEQQVGAGTQDVFDRWGTADDANGLLTLESIDTETFDPHDPDATQSCIWTSRKLFNRWIRFEAETATRSASVTVTDIDLDDPAGAGNPYTNCGETGTFGETITYCTSLQWGIEWHMNFEPDGSGGFRVRLHLRRYVARYFTYHDGSGDLTVVEPPLTQGASWVVDHTTPFISNPGGGNEFQPSSGSHGSSIGVWEMADPCNTDAPWTLSKIYDAYEVYGSDPDLRCIDNLPETLTLHLAVPPKSRRKNCEGGQSP